MSIKPLLSSIQSIKSSVGLFSDSTITALVQQAKVSNNAAYISYLLTNEEHLVINKKLEAVEEAVGNFSDSYITTLLDELEDYVRGIGHASN